MSRNSARVADAADLFDHDKHLQELVIAFGLKAMNFVAQPKIEQNVRQWLGRGSLDPDDPDSDGILAEALMFALELATFTPSLSGATAVDRLVRHHKSAGRDELAALEALKQASFRLLRIKSFGRDGLALVEDLATGRVLSVLDRDLPMIAIGSPIVRRGCVRFQTASLSA